MAVLISVLMPNFNKSKFIGEAIESILAQTHRDFELLIVDDASTDSSVDVVSKYVSRDTRVKLFRSETHKGVAATRNTAIQQARGELIAYQDSDDTCVPERLSSQIEVLKRTGAESVVYSDYCVIDENSEVVESHHNNNRGNGRILPQLMANSFNAQAALLLPRRCFREVGPYDDALEIYEDVDMTLRLAKVFPFVHIPLPLYGRRIYWNNTVNRISRQRRYQRRSLVIARHFSSNKGEMSRGANDAVLQTLFSCYLGAKSYRKMLGLALTNRNGVRILTRTTVRGARNVFGHYRARSSS